jgi:hypothetical protein
VTRRLYLSLGWPWLLATGAAQPHEVMLSFRRVTSCRFATQVAELSCLNRRKQREQSQDSNVLSASSVLSC